MSNNFINYAFFFYFISFLLAVAAAATNKISVEKFFRNIFLFAAILNLISIILRWIEAGRPPFSNLYESIILTVFCFAIAYYWLSIYYKSKALNLCVSITALLVTAYSTLYTDTDIKPLMPALKSNWLIIHVMSYMVSYAIITLSFLVSCIIIVQYFIKKGEFAKQKKKTETENLTDSNKIEKCECSGNISDNEENTKLQLSKINYMLISTAFPLLNMGLITGSVWAKRAWGDYWSWDPKETWALICWFFYVNVLHLPYSLPKLLKKNTRDSLKLIMAVCLIIGFFLVLFTYLGLHLLPSAEKSMHIYK